MKSSMAGYTSIDEYIATFPEEIQATLQELRALIHRLAPEATEAIRYGIPTFILGGNLVHFAAYKRHIGFYPAPSGIEAFQAELAPYRAGKGTLQFPLGKPLPLDLIGRIVEYRVAENLIRAEARAKKKG